jgi:predicted phage terminase large subunit-like protein
VENNFKALMRSNLLAFAMKAFRGMNSGKMPDDPYLEVLADRVASMFVGKTRRLIVNLPPRHFKTWIGSICLSAWVLGRDPSAKILILTYGQELADRIAHGVRAIMRSDWYREAFEHTRLSKTRAKLVDFKTTRGGGVRSVSIKGGVTGHGADLIIVDDPIEIKDCDNLEELERVNELFDNEIVSRLDSPKHGRIIIVAHRVNEQDLSGHLLQQGGWKHLKLPLIAPRARTYKFDDARVWKRRRGDLLRPGAFTRRDVELLQGSKRPGFAILQQQSVDGTQLRIRRDHFTTFMSNTVPMSQSGVVLSIDPGQKGGPAHSYSVIQAWLPCGSKHLLLQQWREQTTYTEVRSAVYRFIKRYHPSVVLIEDTNQGPALLSEIRPRPDMVVRAISPLGDKIERVRRHLGAIRSGCVQLPGDAAWRESFVVEFTLFPNAGYDDQVDAAAQYLEWISQNPAPLPRNRPASGVLVNSRLQPMRFPHFIPDMQTRGGIMLRGRR